MDAAEFEDWLLTWLAEELARPKGTLDADRPFAELGVDSLRATELVGEVEAALGCSLPATLPWDYPTVRALARHLAATPMSADVDALLAELRRRDIELHVEGEQLRIKAPVGTLSPPLRARIAAHKASLIERVGRRPRAMSLSLFFFTSDESAPAEDKYALVLEGARFADAHGFEAVWTPERHFHAMGGPFPNPSLLAVAIASATQRIGVRAGSVVLPLHDPLRVAEEWAVVDQLSHGRAGISIATGWHADDFALAPDAYEDRKARTLERLDVIRRLWRGEAIERTSGSGAPVRVRTFPRPLQRELPVWMTAIGNPDTFRAAGRAGTHLLTCLLGQSLDELREKIALYRAALREAGHDERAGRVALMVHAFVGDSDAAVRDVVRAPFTRYLRTTLDLLGNLASSLGTPLDPRKLDAAQEDALLSFAFDRYLESGALFGGPETCAAKMRAFADLGISELACLVDFGLPRADVMRGLERLARLS